MYGETDVADRYIYERSTRAVVVMATRYVHIWVDYDTVLKVKKYDFHTVVLLVILADENVHNFILKSSY